MTAPDYIPNIFQKEGMSVKLEKGNLNKLQHYIASNKPIVVLLRSGERFWHYVVAIGYDYNGIFIADPYPPASIYCEPTNIFLAAWNFTGDLEGNKMPAADFYRMLAAWADVQGNLMYVPK